MHRLFIWGLLLGCWAIVSGCERKAGNSNAENILKNGTANLTGAQLAQGYCSSCHLMPAPDLLPKHIWKDQVLPNMALRLGVGTPDQNPYAGLPYEDILLVSKAGIFPDKPQIALADWQKIVKYYLTEAPEKSLPQAKKIKVSPNLPGFSIVFLPFRRPPLTTLLKFDNLNTRLFTGNQQNDLFILNKNLQTIDSFRLESPPVDVVFNQNGKFDVLTIGKINPSDRESGKLIAYQNTNAGHNQSELITKLKRPVQVSYADLNQDGQLDAIICNYGHHTGKLAWYEKGANGFKEHILKETPGARQVLVHDFNHDNLPDLLVLMTQAQEGIYIFINLGKGKFSEKTVLRFPPVYGSAYINLADINQDGALDIIYTNGDNADYSYTLKKYHGVRIFLNDGKNNFKQSWFYPMHGASMAIARDFDQDGDLDIAAIAFFPDYEKSPSESFIYFENTGKLTFKPFTFPEADIGRWLTLETGDFDQDGDADIMLGSYIASPVPAPPALQRQWQTKSPHILILKNKLKN